MTGHMQDSWSHQNYVSHTLPTTISKPCEYAPRDIQIYHIKSNSSILQNSRLMDTLAQIPPNKANCSLLYPLSLQLSLLHT